MLKKRNTKTWTNIFRAHLGLGLFGLIGLMGIVGIGISGCEKGPIKVGFSGQLTGVYSDLGVQGRNGVQLAIEELNAQGGIKNRRLELLAENDKNNINSAIEADKKLIDQGVKAIIGHMTSSQTLGVLPFVEENNIPLISPTTSTPLLDDRKDVVFRLNPSSMKIAEALGQYAFNSLGIREIAIIYDLKNRAYSMPYYSEFSRVFENLGGKIACRYAFSSDEPVDMQNCVGRIESSGLQSVFIVASSADTAIFCQKAYERGLDLQILSSGWAYTTNLLQYGGKAIEGIIFADSFSAEIHKSEFIDFKERYRERYGREPHFAATQGYESMLLLAEGLRRRDEYNGDLLAALQSVKEIDGLTGPLYFNEYGDVERPYFFNQVKDGDFQLIDSMSNGQR